MYDLVITGGRLFDPAAGIDEVGDLAIRDGRIVALGRDVVREEIGRTLDARGLLVTPGLIDLHVHAFEYATDFGVPPDSVGVRCGVTTICDQGSAGHLNLPAFRKFVIEHATTEMFLFIAITAVGVPKGSMLTVLHSPEAVELEPTIAAIEANRDLVRGIKAHADMGAFARWGTRVFDLALEAANATGVPVYVHTGLLFDPGGHPMPAPDEVLPMAVPKLRPGDIIAHPFTSMPGGILGTNGRVQPVVKEALARGVLLDVGHGAHFSFAVAERVLAEGILPYSVSSDVHADFNDPHSRKAYYGLTETMGKLLALGVSLADVIRMATWHPAQVLREADRIGSLRPGYQADVTLLRLEEGEFAFSDMVGETRRGALRLVPQHTVKRGVVYAPGEAAGIYQAHYALAGD
ncbi:MAG TPA: amidohydrolase/deacetylase family metallohydrolase [Chloroflexota bacterium]|nr:amidohydrolase/deacetylase family metallohydrolase [Chloroflexota bacterium]